MSLSGPSVGFTRLVHLRVVRLWPALSVIPFPSYFRLFFHHRLFLHHPVICGHCHLPSWPCASWTLTSPPSVSSCILPQAVFRVKSAFILFPSFYPCVSSFLSPSLIRFSPLLSRFPSFSCELHSLTSCELSLSFSLFSRCRRAPRTMPPSRPNSPLLSLFLSSLLLSLLLFLFLSPPPVYNLLCSPTTPTAMQRHLVCTCFFSRGYYWTSPLVGLHSSFLFLFPFLFSPCLFLLSLCKISPCFDASALVSGHASS